MPDAAASRTQGRLAHRVHLHAQEDGYLVASWENVLMVFPFGELTRALLQASVAAHHEVYARHPEGIAVLAVVRGTPPIPGSEARKMSSEHIRSTAGQVLAQVTLIEAEGFWAAALRGVITTINLLARAPNPTRVLATRADAANWLGQQLGKGRAQDEWQVGLLTAIDEASRRTPALSAPAA